MKRAADAANISTLEHDVADLKAMMVQTLKGQVSWKLALPRSTFPQLTSSTC